MIDGGELAADAESVADAGAVLELEAVGARSWPALESEWQDGWLLRASRGWTGRANSALPLGQLADGGSAARIAAVERWYATRDLAPTIAVPLPLMAPLADELLGLGWVPRHGADVMTTTIAAVLASIPPRPDLPEVQVATEPSEPWLAAYHYRGGRLPAYAIDVLRGADARFLSLHLDGEVVAIVRTVVEAPWVGLTAMEVAPTHRGRGLALHLLRGALEQASQDGAERAWLQVDPANDAGQGLYRRAGFTVHHAYRYFQRTATAPEDHHRPDDGDGT